MLREQQGFTHGALAAALGKETGTIIEWEAATRRIGVSELLAVARCFSVPISYFTEGISKRK